MSEGTEKIDVFVGPLHTICTCYMGRLCMTTHSSWEEFLTFYNEHKKTCTQCQRTEKMLKETQEKTGFNSMPGPNSTYTEMRGY